MVSKRTPRNAAKKPKPAEVIELSSDSDSEPDVSQKEKISEKEISQKDYQDQPLLRVEGIKYDDALQTKAKSAKPRSQNKTSPIVMEPSAKPSAKLPVRVKDTGSAKHRHVSIEIQLPTSSMLAKGKEGLEIPDSEDGGDEDIFKTPVERHHITFNDSDHDEFVTPMEAPLKNPLELSLASKPAQEVEDSDDEAPPEAVSSHVAEAQLAKASRAATKAAEQQAATQKRKRKERDAFFKQQAEERKSTQKLDGKSEDDEVVETKGPAPLFPEKRKREIPKILPLEFLESDDEDEPGPDSDSAANGRSKKMKLTLAGPRWLAEPRAPRDQRVGSTVFRVVENRGDGKLAPKVNKNSVNLKEAILKLNRTPKAKGGFFVKKC